MRLIFYVRILCLYSNVMYSKQLLNSRTKGKDTGYFGLIPNRVSPVRSEKFSNPLGI